MESTVGIIGTNGSLTIPAAQHLLQHSPNALHEAVAKFPATRVSITTIDLGQLQAVNKFAGHIADEVAQGTLLELSNLLNSDGCGKTLRVSCMVHFALVLRLLGSFQATSSRVVLLAGNGHKPGNNPLEMVTASIPSDAAEATRDAARRAIGEANLGEREHFTLLKPEPGSSDSQDEAAQEALGSKSAQ